MIKLVVNFQLKYGGNLLLAPTDKSSYYLPRLAQEESDDISISYRGVESLEILSILFTAICFLIMHFNFSSVCMTGCIIC